MEHLKKTDPEVYRAVVAETEREEYNLELIASENYTSRAVIETLGTVLTNKYAEGYPRKRYYGGCEYVDNAESLAISRACKLFSAEHANVQPHSGSQANMAVYFSIIKPGDKILGMDLAHGGHLTHGCKINFSGQLYDVATYGVTEETGRIDYDQLAKIARREQPKVIVAGASSYTRTLDFERFRQICDEVGAYLFVDMAHIAGLVAAGVHPNPVPIADFTTMTTHKTFRGPRGGIVFCKKEYAAKLDKIVFPGLQGGPLMHVIAAKAVALQEAMQPEYAQYQSQVVLNAQELGRGLVQRGYDIVSGGTDNHIVLLDLRSKDLTGKVAEAALDLAHITVNKNRIPFDPHGPMVTSGVRLGTPAVTTRGMGTAEMGLIAEWIVSVLNNPADADLAVAIGKKVHDLCAKFPMYKDLLCV